MVWLDCFRRPDWVVLVEDFLGSDSKNLAHDPPINFTVRIGLDRAFRGLSPHGARGGLLVISTRGHMAHITLLSFVVLNFEIFFKVR